MRLGGAPAGRAYGPSCSCTGVRRCPASVASDPCWVRLHFLGLHIRLDRELRGYSHTRVDGWLRHVDVAEVGCVRLGGVVFGQDYHCYAKKCVDRLAKVLRFIAGVNVPASLVLALSRPLCLRRNVALKQLTFGL